MNADVDQMHNEVLLSRQEGFYLFIYLIFLVAKCHGVALPSGSASQIITYTLQMRV